MAFFTFYAILRLMKILHSFTLALLMIFGGNTVQRALTELSGSNLSPVAFSFGWLAYTISMLKWILKKQRPTSTTDLPFIVVNGKDGVPQVDSCRILGKLVHSIDGWITEEAEIQAAEQIIAWHRSISIPINPANELRIFFFKSVRPPGGVETVLDWLPYGGVLVAFIQIGISLVPWVVRGSYFLFFITLTGIHLAFAAGVHLQWNVEKRGFSRKDHFLILTPDRKARNVLVMFGENDYFDNPMLATSYPTMMPSMLFCTALLVGIWVLHHAVTFFFFGIEDSMYLLEIYLIGFVYNHAISGKLRKPESLGFPLKFEKCIAAPRRIDALKEVEKFNSDIGSKLWEIYDQESLKEEMDNLWDDSEIQQS